MSGWTSVAPDPKPMMGWTSVAADVAPANTSSNNGDEEEAAMDGGDDDGLVDSGDEEAEIPSSGSTSSSSSSSSPGSAKGGRGDGGANAAPESDMGPAPLPADHGVSETKWVKSAVPPMCLTESCVMGIDEAGRGAALGPMTYGIAFWADSVHEEMCALNFDDSKAMTAQKREGLFRRLKATPQIGWMVKLISSKEISDKMLRRVPISLNAISHDCAMELVDEALKAGVQVSKVIVDTVGDPVSYQRKLTMAFDNRIEFIVEKKADANYRPVSAASICAKVLRDKVSGRRHAGRQAGRQAGRRVGGKAGNKTCGQAGGQVE